MNKILVIGKKEDGATVFGSAELFVKKMQGRTKSQVFFAYFDDFNFLLSQEGAKVWDAHNERDLSDYDFVFIRDWFDNARDDLVLSLAFYLDSHKVPFLNEEALKGRSRGKLSQYMLAALSNTPMPQTFCSIPENIENFAKGSDFWGFPAILKASNTSRGRYNFLVHSSAELQTAIEQMDGKTALLQEYIPNECDYRVLVVNGEVMMMIRRARTDNTSHLNNTSQGATAEEVPFSTLPEKLVQQTIGIAKTLGRSFTGIDIIENSDKHGDYRLLEINNMPQMETGSLVEEKLTAAATMLDKLVS